MQEAFDNYCLNSSLHGLKYIGDYSIPLLARLFWLASFTAAIFFAIYFIVILYEKYDKTPVIVSFDPQLVKINEIPFPAITICNVNVALKSRAELINQNGPEIKKQLLADLCKSRIVENNSEHDQFGNGLEWPVVKEFIININQKCGEMFKVCMWDGALVECSKIINTVLTDEGYCCSFNRLPINYSLQENLEETFSNHYPSTIIDWNSEARYPQNTPYDAYPYRSFGAGEGLGLTVVIDANLAEYYCTSTGSFGFKVHMSTPIEVPKITDFGFLISPGSETRVAIAVDLEDATPGVEGIDYRKRQCFFALERSLRFFRMYTERSCRMECETNFTLRACGCVPYYFPKDNDTKICGQRKALCTASAKDIMERFSIERTKCNCLPACHEIKFFPRSISVGRIDAKYDTVRPEFMQNTSREYFAENMAIVHFFYPVDKFAKRTKSEMYGFSEFLSNTGGLLSLFLGFSFLSVIELLFFVCMSAIYHFLRPRWNGNGILMYPFVN